MTLPVFKSRELTLNISSSTRVIQNTQTEFFTYDYESAKNIVNLQLDGNPLDLNEVKSVKFLFDFDLIEVRRIEEATFIDLENGVVELILPSWFYEYDNNLFVYVYIDFLNNQTMDAGAYQTRFSTSKIDQIFPELEPFYVRKFEDLADELRAIVDNKIGNLDDLLAEYNDKFETLLQDSDYDIRQMIIQAKSDIDATILQANNNINNTITQANNDITTLITNSTNSINTTVTNAQNDVSSFITNGNISISAMISQAEYDIDSAINIGKFNVNTMINEASGDVADLISSTSAQLASFLAQGGTDLQELTDSFTLQFQTFLGTSETEYEGLRDRVDQLLGQLTVVVSQESMEAYVAQAQLDFIETQPFEDRVDQIIIDLATDFITGEIDNIAMINRPNTFNGLNNFTGGLQLNGSNMQTLLDNKAGIYASTNEDLDKIVTAGFYRIGGSAPNAPSNYGNLIVARGLNNADTALQIYGGYNTGQLHYRGTSNVTDAGSTSWQPWRTVLNDVDLTAINISIATKSGLTTTNNFTGSNSFTGQTSFGGTTLVNGTDITNIGTLLNAKANISGNNTLSGTNNFTGTLQLNGTNITTLINNAGVSLSANNTWTGNNTYTGNVTLPDKGTFIKGNNNPMLSFQTASGTTTGSLRANNSGSFVVAGSGGDVFLRPVSDESSTGQFRVSANGNVEANGNITTTGLVTSPNVIGNAITLGDGTVGTKALTFKSGSGATSFIQVHAGDANGDAFVIQSGGSIYMGSGESPANLKNALGIANGTESLFLSSDTYASIYVNCQTIADRREIRFLANGNVTGLATVTATTFSGTLSGNATTSTTLATARTINGTSFNGSANITTANWGTARTLTIGNTGKSVNGSANISWSLAEIGALPLAGGTITGNLTVNGNSIVGGILTTKTITATSGSNLAINVGSKTITINTTGNINGVYELVADNYIGTKSLYCSDRATTENLEVYQNATVNNDLAVTRNLTVNSQAVWSRGDLRTCRGNLDMTPSANNGASNVAVTFPKEMGGGANVNVLPFATTTVPGTEVTGVAPSAITATGFQLNVRRTNAVSTSIRWIAFWQS